MQEDIDVSVGFMPSDLSVLLRDVLPRYFDDGEEMTVFWSSAPSGASSDTKSSEGGAKKKTTVNSKESAKKVKPRRLLVPLDRPRVMKSGDLARLAQKACYRRLAPDAETGDVSDVVTWVSLLPLTKDYGRCLESQGIDGEVLWSDLGRKDLFDIGVDEVADVELLLSILTV